MAHQIKQRHLDVVDIFVVTEQLFDNRDRLAGRESLGRARELAADDDTRIVTSQVDELTQQGRRHDAIVTE